LTQETHFNLAARPCQSIAGLEQ